MKKIITSIIAVLYLSLSTGIAMEVHYCMGSFAGVEFFEKENEKCGKCGMTEKKGGCCSDEHKFYKISDSHKDVKNAISLETPFTFIFNFYQPYKFAIANNNNAVLHNNNSPPVYNKPSVCILNCIFRI